MNEKKIGVWLIGARGGVASTAILGLAALKRGLIESAGLVSQLPRFQRLKLADWGRFVVGGHEIRRAPLAGEVARIVEQTRIPMADLLEQCRPELEEIDRRIRPGTTIGVGETIAKLADLAIPQDETPRQAVERLARDMNEFVAAENIEHLIVVNISSTEPPAEVSRSPSTWGELEKLLDHNSAQGGQSHFRGENVQSTSDIDHAAKIGTVPDCPLPASSLYAIAALQSGHSFVNFTPSLADSPAAIDELARTKKACHYGCDGKTGETLMKSVLAPMFARRNLRVRSWVGHNIFGNMDGQVLDDPENKRAKVASKDHLIREILGYKPNTLVSIEYLPDLGDWKTAWDHIHFAGFLGVPMTLQFTWQGSDSALAAPLVLDLVRLTEYAHRLGHIGQMPFLASFFKSPYGATEHCFDRQFESLEQWAAECEAASDY
ncbi:MAG: inositol-3-phosphate synthase [Pirellulales bacterium]|nr:inositol-3-phosphate synthase [Pirellulales bacterium]